MNLTVARMKARSAAILDLACPDCAAASSGLRALVLALLACGCDSDSIPGNQPAPPISGPARCGNSSERPWCNTALAPQQRADLLLAQMTLMQKFELMAGDDPAGVATGEPATGTVNGIPALGIPPLYMSDGPVGPRERQATAFPSPLALGASFDPLLAYRVGQAIATEVKLKGNDLIHAPTVDLMRVPQAGRTFETYGEDPYLSASLAPEWVRGVQSTGVIANVKHYALNTQEGQVGAPPLASVIGPRHLVSANVSERALREMHLLPFEAAVKLADPGSIMCSYNRVNGVPACGNAHLLQEILRDEWGFDGFVVTDYVLAAKDTIGSANAGTEIEMPIGQFYQPVLLQLAVISGQVSEATIDVRVGNILRTLFRFGFFDRADFPSDDALIDRAAGAEVARHNLEQGMVLLQNDGTLPIASTVGSIVVIGTVAETYVNGGGSSAVEPFEFKPPRAAIEQRGAAAGMSVTFDAGGDPAAAAALAQAADVAIVFVADSATEGTDKNCLSLDCGPAPGIPSSTPQDDLVEAVAAANPRTVVVMETGGPVLTPWRSSVAALVAAWYPGQEAGPAIARVLFGDTDPGGRLPVTFMDAEGDTPVAGNPAQYPGVANEVEYSEDVFLGYRWFDQEGVAPAFPFGHGLSYATFELSSLRVLAFGDEAVATIDVRNTGTRAGWAVPQLYVGLPSPGPSVLQPPRQLRGARKLWLEPGQGAAVEFPLSARAFSYWEEGASQWRIAEGCYSVQAGSSSRELPLRGTLTRSAGGFAAGGAC